jgi:putative NADH-flavin reductase
MKILILGATGGTGIEIVRQALELGHDVTTLVRSPERLGDLREKVGVEKGSPLDLDALANALYGKDAVLSAFGPRIPIDKGDEHLLRSFAHTLVHAMKIAGVRRVIVESAAFLFKDAVIPPAYVVGRLLFPKVVHDQADMERIVRGSDLDWTIMRPPRLTDSAMTGRVRIRYGHLPRFGFSIPRADVAFSFLKLLETPKSVRQIVGVSS